VVEEEDVESVGEIKGSVVEVKEEEEEVGYGLFIY
jgi:hypothetical protein